MADIKPQSEDHGPSAEAAKGRALAAIAHSQGLLPWPMLASPGLSPFGVPMQVSAPSQFSSAPTSASPTPQGQVLGSDAWVKKPLRPTWRVAVQRSSGIALGGLLLLGSPLFSSAARADNSDDLRRLLSSKVCQGCNLSNAGLVFANLEAAALNNADLRRANLSRATLSNADLRGANLAGAVLYGANLYNADLTGADLRGADLRGAYLGGAKLEAGQLQGAALQGAIAIPANLIPAETYQTWAMDEAQASRHEAAVTYYNQAIAQEPKLATAYLGRSFSVSILGNLEQATNDATTAKSLFEAEGNQPGLETADQILATIEQAKAAAIDWDANPKSKSPAQTASRSNGGFRNSNWGRSFTSLFKSVGTMVFKMLF